ncbi:zinc finger protein 410 [Protopterus annectens]|uniref:zinc finger protein 410 n=1 Tax=Protopterus annectens TaxID=7888 RepID=UPI001CF94D90|nr:zinc finger protein 410 [Protopterus annectens]
MLSDELEGKPELLVEFVQNTSIPLAEELVESDPKEITCLSLLPVAESSECSQLSLAGSAIPQEDSIKCPTSALLRSLESDVENERDESRGQSSPKLSEILPSPGSPSLLQDIQQNDSTSFILLNLARSGLGTSAEHLVFVQDEAEDVGSVFPSTEAIDNGAPWFLRVQELAHDSLIAATRAQLAKDAKASHDGDNLISCPADGHLKGLTTAHQPQRREKRLKCTFEGCDRTFVWPAHLKYHMKTHKNDRSFICPKEGCGKSFYVLQRLNVHMRTHNGEKPFICAETGCGKQFTTAGNLKNHQRIHTGEKPYICETEGCARCFAEYSSLRKHMVVHSGEKPHQCTICGRNFSQSGSRNVHMRKHHGKMSLSSPDQSTETEVLHENPDSANTLPSASVVVLPQPHDLVTVTAGRHSYEDEVSSLLQ